LTACIRTGCWVIPACWVRSPASWWWTISYLPGLYRDGGPYPAWNPAGFVALFVPVGLTLVAITTGALQWFYTYGWFTGSILGGLLYYLVSARKLVSGPR
jgi:cytosine/uracil/thiamine/allantoin permease